jgi:hypothetical protein
MTWKLPLAILLMGAQACILVIGLFGARVSDGYRAYFITHTTPRVYMQWPGPDTVPETAIRPRPSEKHVSPQALAPPDR